MGHLLGDRFLILDDNVSIDLASGQRVTIRMSEPSARSEQQRWIERCSSLMTCDHPHHAQLVDYGLVGSGQRFEVYRRSSNLGIRPASHSAVGQVIDWLETTQTAAGILYLAGSSQRGTTAVVEAVAREARVRGFIPLNVVALVSRGDTLEREVRRLVAGRHLLLLDDRTQPRKASGEDLAHMLMTLGTSANRSTLVMVVVAPGQHRAPCVFLDRVSPASLAISPLPKVSEMRSAYEVRRFRAQSVDPGDPRAIGLLREGETLLRLGRHAPAERQLRAALGAFSRREDWLNAGRSGLLLGRLLLVRGRAASVIFDTARDDFLRAQATELAAHAMIYVGLAQTDQATLAESEATLRAALVAASLAPERGAEGPAVLALARCLFWQGRYAEARALLERTECLDRLEPSDVARRWCLGARVMLALGDIARAGWLIRKAEAIPARDEATAALISSIQAALQARVGDMAALRMHVRDGLRAARAAHLPLCALGLRFTLCEALASDGEVEDARRFCARLASIKGVTLPSLMRARLARLRQSLESAPSSGSCRGIVPAVCESSVSMAAQSDGAQGSELNQIDLAHVTEVLFLCHEIEDEREALSRAAQTIRKQVGALAVGFFAKDASEIFPVAVSGVLATATAERSIDSGLCIQPHRTTSGIEASLPVRYAGAIVGAVGARWTVEGPADGSRAMALITLAAAACAPMLRIAVDRRTSSADPTPDSDLLGVSPAIHDVRRAILRASNAPFAVLIEGESGVGKELVAQAIHRSGCRRDRRFRALNCAALADDLVDTELFGHARGAFTGATQDRAGLFEDAGGGTVFLDEISDLSLRAQAKLLRVLQEGEIRRIGESFTRPVEARLVAATNRSLQAEVEAGRFRQDLFYRLNVIRIGVPPLRDRPEDISILTGKFWKEATERVGSKAVLGQSATAALARHDWPGNVRELQNILYALAVNGPRRGVIGASALPAAIVQAAAPADGGTLEIARRTFEEHFVRAALARAAGHRGRAAVALGLSRQGLAKLIQRLGLERHPDAAAACARPGRA